MRHYGMRHSSPPRRLSREPVTEITTGTGRPSHWPSPPRPPDIQRLAVDLAAEWCCRQEDCELAAFEVAS